MFILSKRNIILQSPDSQVSVHVRRNYIGEIPDWAAGTEYFKGLVADGKIVITGKTDKATQAAAEKPVKVRRGKTDK